MTRRSAIAPAAVAGAAIPVLIALVALLAPWVAPSDPSFTYTGLLNAPPTRPHLRDADGSWHPPSGRLLQSSQPDRAPLLLAGADSLGRDVFSRTIHGARLSLGVALVAALGALVIGVAAGSVAGYAGGVVDDLLMRGSEVVLVLPTIYVVMALRSVLPLVLTPAAVFTLLVLLFSIVGAPIVARAVRGVVRSERRRDYATAAESLGASPARVLGRHLLPAAAGVVFVQLITLVPGFIVAEATLSYVGFGFPDSVATWGTMLHEATNVRAIADFPWVLAPVVAMFLVVFGMNAVPKR
jgi:peptide/nickel transport system permease protein